MTQKQRDEYTRALERAHKAGIEISGRGIVKATGERMYAVTSGSEASRWHIVRVSGAQLVCDCTAATHGRYCQHRAIVREQLGKEAAEAQASIDAMDGLKAATERLAEQNRAWVAQQAERDSAPVYRSNAPFSIFKTA